MTPLLFFCSEIVVIIIVLQPAFFSSCVNSQRKFQRQQFPHPSRDEFAGDKHNSSTQPFVFLRVSDFPPRSVQVSGVRENITDAYGGFVGVSKYLGIPFAVPAVDNLRFQRPTLNILRVEYEANQDPTSCPQLDSAGVFTGDENCLFLNVFVPEVKDEGSESEEPLSRLPVLVWFHGERSALEGVPHEIDVLSSGSASMVTPDVFLTKKIVVVTPQYRLGSLGFLSTTNEDLNGNMAIFDQLLALEWVKRFIASFGGDPKQVTVMGHGGSAMTLGLLATSDLAQDLFHRVILMAGSPLSPLAVDPVPRSTFAEIAFQNSCPSFPTLRFVRCMQRRTVSSVILADQRLKEGKNVGALRVALPVIQRNADGRFFPPIVSLDPLLALQRGHFQQVPLLVGVSSAEMAGYLPTAGGTTAEKIARDVFGGEDTLKQFIRKMISRKSQNPELDAELIAFEYFAGLNVSARIEQATDLMEELLSDYFYHLPALTLASLWSKSAPVNFYVFDYLPQADIRPDGVDGKSTGVTNQASHGTDLNFLMNGHKGNAMDRQLWESMVEFWANFVHKGSPLNAGIDWPQFREGSPQHLIFRERPEIGNSFRTRQVILWMSLLEKMGGLMCKSASGKVAD